MLNVSETKTFGWITTVYLCLPIPRDSGFLANDHPNESQYDGVLIKVQLCHNLREFWQGRIPIQGQTQWNVLEGV